MQNQATATPKLNTIAMLGTPEQVILAPFSAKIGTQMIDCETVYYDACAVIDALLGLPFISSLTFADDECEAVKAEILNVVNAIALMFSNSRYNFCFLDEYYQYAHHWVHLIDLLNQDYDPANPLRVLETMAVSLINYFAIAIDGKTATLIQVGQYPLSKLFETLDGNTAMLSDEVEVIQALQTLLQRHPTAQSA